MKRLRTVLVYLLLATLVAAGAVWATVQFNLLGPKTVNIHGTVTRDGQPLEWRTEDDRELRVIFLPDTEQRDNTTPLYPAEADPATGKYHVKDIPPGRYKVSVQMNNPGYQDILGMALDPGYTNIVKEVSAEEGQEIPIDIPKVLPKRQGPAGPRVVDPDALPNRRPRPAPDADTGEKKSDAEPDKKSEPDRKPEPGKKPESEKKPEPGKKSEPEKKPESK